MKFLLLRGLMREQRHWGEFPRILESQLPGSEVFCLDLPGTGSESHRPCPASVEEIADDVRSRWLKIHQEGDEWSLVGISLGGMVAMRWCSLFQADFKRLVVINSSARGLSPPWHRLKIGMIPNLISSVIIGNRVERELQILKMTTCLRTDLDGIARVWGDFAIHQPIPARTAPRQLMAAIRFCAPSRSEFVKLKMLVVSGHGDRFTDPSCSKKIAEHFQADYVVHPSAGHDLPLDDPQWLVREVARWMSSA